MDWNIWSEDNIELSRQYQMDNYEVELLNADSDRCLIACSSNGLYFPNTKETFQQVILESNRYEWKNICQNPRVRESYGKVIYIRDIYKQWYVTGLNAKAATIDRMAELLRKETAGYRIITLGNSAGGYIATILGYLLQAEMVLNISGQFSIEDGIEKNTFLRKYSTDVQRNRYYNLVPYLRGSTVPVFYFYPGQVQEDRNQYAQIQGCSCVYSFEFATQKHGETMYGFNYPYVLTMEAADLKRLQQYYQGKQIGKSQFLYKTAGPMRGTIELSGKFLRKIKG